MSADGGGACGAGAGAGAAHGAPPHPMPPGGAGSAPTPAGALRAWTYFQSRSAPTATPPTMSHVFPESPRNSTSGFSRGVSECRRRLRMGLPQNENLDVVTRAPDFFARKMTATAARPR